MEGSGGSLQQQQQQRLLSDWELTALAVRRKLMASELRSKADAMRGSDRSLEIQRMLQLSTNRAPSAAKTGQLRPILARKDQRVTLDNDDSSAQGTEPQLWKGPTSHIPPMGSDAERFNYTQGASRLQTERSSTQAQRNAERSDFDLQTGAQLYRNQQRSASVMATERLSTGIRAAPSLQETLDLLTTSQRGQELQRRISQEQDLQRRLAARREQEINQLFLQAQNQEELANHPKPLQDYDLQRRLELDAQLDLQRRLEARRELDLQQRLSAQLERDLKHRIDAIQEQKLQQLLNYRDEQDLQNRLNAGSNQEADEPLHYGIAHQQEFRQRLRESQELDRLLSAQRDSEVEQRSRLLSREQELDRLLAIQSALLQQPFKATGGGTSTKLLDRFDRDERFKRHLSTDTASGLTERDLEMLSRAGRRAEYSHREAGRQLLSRNELERRLNGQRDLSEDLLKSMEAQGGAGERQMQEVGDATRNHPSRDQQLYSDEPLPDQDIRLRHREDGGLDDGKRLRIRRNSDLLHQRDADQSRSRSSSAGRHIKLGVPSDLAGRASRCKKTALLASSSNEQAHRRLSMTPSEAAKHQMGAMDDHKSARSSGSTRSMRHALEMDANFSSSDDDSSGEAAERARRLLSDKEEPSAEPRRSRESVKSAASSAKSSRSSGHPDKGSSRQSGPEKIPRSEAARSATPVSEATEEDDRMTQSSAPMGQEADNEQPTRGGGATRKSRRRSSGRGEPPSTPDPSDRAAARRRSESRRASRRSDDDDDIDDDEEAGRRGKDGVGRRRASSQRKPSRDFEARRRQSRNHDPSSSDEEDTPRRDARRQGSLSGRSQRSEGSGAGSRPGRRRSSNADSRFQEVAKRTEADAESDSGARRATDTPDGADDWRSAGGPAAKRGQRRQSSEVRPAVDRSLNTSMAGKFDARPAASTGDQEREPATYRNSGRSRHNKAAPDSNTQDSEHRTAHEETRDTDTDDMYMRSAEEPRRPEPGGKVQLLDRGFLMAFKDAAGKQASKQAAADSTAQDREGNMSLSTKKALARTVNRVPAVEGSATQVKPEDTLTQEDIEACKTRAQQKNEQRRKRKEQAIVATVAGPGGAPADDAFSDSDEDEEVAPLLQKDETASRQPTRRRVEVEAEENAAAPVVGKTVREDTTTAPLPTGGDEDVMALERHRKSSKLLQRKPRAPSKTRSASAARAPMAPPRRELDRLLPNSAPPETLAARPPPICCPTVCLPRCPPSCCRSCGVACCYPVAGSYCCARCRMC